MTSSGYILDRELLSSSRNLIDANSNNPLLQATTTLNYRSSYGTSPRPYTANYSQHSYSNGFSENYDSKRVVADLQDQIRLLRNDLEKKDGLIQELTSLKEPPKVEHLDPINYEAIAGPERAALDVARRDLDQCRMKLEAVSQELRESTIKLASKDEIINELKQESDTIRRELSSFHQKNQQLQVRIHELESNMNCYDSAANKSTLTITTLQKDAREKQEQILELQSRLRTHMEEREASERKSEYLHKRLQELFSRLSITLEHDLPITGTAAFDLLMNKINEINADNITMKGKMTKLEEQNNAFDTEAKANRTTIQHMANQLHIYEQNNVSQLLQIDTVKGERDMALNEKSALQVEVDTLKGRLESVQKAWQNTRIDFEQRETKYTTGETQVKQLENDLLYAKSNHDMFLSHVAQLLSDGFVKVEPKEDEIKEKIQLLMNSSKDRGVIITNLQNQKEQLSKQLQEQIDINKDIDGKRRHAEDQWHELEYRIKALDTDYSTNEAYRENLKKDKAKFFNFLERLATILKIENVSNELGYELNPDVVLIRVEQLMRLERESTADQKTTIQNLQKKVSLMKEQMENKDLHLDLLRKKVVSLEEGRAGKTDLEREIDDHVMLARKMKVKVDHLTQQVSDLRQENIQLKAQITDIQTLKNRSSDQDLEIRRLLEDIAKLESVRDRQAVKISNLQDKLHSTDDEANRNLRSSDNAMRALSNEVRFLKTSLEQLAERERRLLDFRSLVARMLGLDSKSLSVPDYEITTRLEHLINSTQPPMIVPMMPVIPSVNDFSTSRTQATTTIYPREYSVNHSSQTRQRSPSPVSRHVNTQHQSRSHSPSHSALDPRTY